VAQEHVPGLAEVTVLVRRGGRVVPVAMRLDGAKGRWELVELQILTARLGLARARGRRSTPGLVPADVAESYPLR
jgi:hypothetical protein